MPTGHVSTWHERTIRQPSAISSAVPKLTSSAPRSAATITSRPVLIPPSTRSRTRPRRPFSASTCCVSASPTSQGSPALLIELSGLAAGPPPPRGGPARFGGGGGGPPGAPRGPPKGGPRGRAPPPPPPPRRRRPPP